MRKLLIAAVITTMALVTGEAHAIGEARARHDVVRPRTD